MSTDPEFPAALRAIIRCPTGGNCVMSAFPGLDSDIAGDAYIDPMAMAETLDAIQHAGATLLVVLTEEGELPAGAFAQLHEGAAARRLDLAFLPIPDYQFPDDEMMQRWQALEQSRPDMPAAGGTIAFACLYGAGRSGSMTAFVLIKQGMSTRMAIDHVREGFAEAVESEAQIGWLERLGAAEGTA